MKKRILLLAVTMSLLLSGCGTLIPKKVELFQDKVKKYPIATQAQKEVQREAAQRAKEKAIETLQAAVSEEASPSVVEPAKETVILTDAVAESVGPPLKRPTIDTLALADEVRKTIAQQAKKIDSFVADNNENIGKKIEGTGVVQVPYFVWAGGFAFVVFVGWHLAKTALTAASAANPGALIGVGGMNLTGAAVSKGVSQLVLGGKNFLKWVDTTIEDPAVKAKITEAFLTSHKEAQDSDIKAVVDNLIK